MPGLKLEARNAVFKTHAQLIHLRADWPRASTHGQSALIFAGDRELHGTIRKERENCVSRRVDDGSNP